MPSLLRTNRALGRLIKGLATPEALGHPIEGFELAETHISYVLLAGPYAYKFKKPVDFGFLDFTTIEKRKFYCEEELRLNRRLAPELYLEVVAVTGTEDAPRLGGPGSPIEYCVKMRRFPRAAQLDQVLARGELTGDLLEALAKTIAEFHDGAEIATADVPYGNASEVAKYALENFTQIGRGPKEIDAVSALASLRAWTEGQLGRHRELIAERKRQGRVRQCHGDLHLTNMVLLEGRIVVFDGIEFNAALSFVDVMSEIAFLLMDLDARERPDLAWIFLNHYLEATGDYEGLPLLDLYRVYRSLVRAKVACLEYYSEGGGAACLARYERHLALAGRYAEPRPPGLILLTHGVSGVGKTAQSTALIPRLGALRIRSDVERKRLAGLSAGAKSASTVAGGIYDAAMTDRTYARLLELARLVSGCGISVIVDATFLRRARREAFAGLARSLGAPFRILDFRAGEAAVHARIARRAAAGQDASEANLAVLEYQRRSQELLMPHEQSLTLIWDTECPGQAAPIAAELERLTQRPPTRSSAKTC
ncbi:MAG: AAA family ATPase [Gammaproteobacteria bacterium]